MNFTIADLLSSPELEGTSVAAGINGLHNEITGVMFIEFPMTLPVASFLTPKSLDLQEKGHLILSSLFAVSNSVEEQILAIKSFVDRGSCGVLLFHVGYVITTIDKSIIDLCNELNYPLIVMPPYMLYSVAHTVILNHLSVNQMKKLEFAKSMYEKMTMILLNEKDADNIVLTLSEMIDKKVFFYDFNSQCAFSSAKPDEALEKYIRRNLHLRQNKFLEAQEDMFIPSLTIGQQLLLVPVSSAVFFYGVLVICDAENLSELDLVAISHAKNTLGIISFNKVKMKEFNALLMRDFVNELVTRENMDDNLIVQRGLAFGFNASNVKMAGVVDIRDFSKLIYEYSESQLQEIKACLQQIVQSQLSICRNKNIAVNYSDKIIMLFCGDKNEEFKKEHIAKICESIIQEAKNKKLFEVTIGLGSFCHNITQIKNSYENALSALKLINNMSGHSDYVFYEDIPLYAMIFSNLDTSLSAEFSDKILEPLIEHDKKTNGELIKTLAALMECGLSVSAAADKIFVHKNTILQRKKKILELLKNDPFSGPYRLQYELALLLSGRKAEL